MDGENKGKSYEQMGWFLGENLTFFLETSTQAVKRELRTLRKKLT